MGKSLNWLGFLVLLCLPLAEAAKPHVEIQGVDFKYDETQPQSRLEISLNQEAAFEKNTANQQVIIEIKNAKISKKLARQLDTSSFKTNVILISPYQSKNNVRVVLQLKDQDEVDVHPEGNKIVAVINNQVGGASPAATPPATAPSEASTSQATTEAVSPSTPPAAAETTPPSAQPATAATENTTPNPQGSSTPVAQAPADSTNLNEFFQAQQSKNYTGRKMVLQMRDADIQDVFRAISEASEFNIVLGDEVRGKLTLDLVDVPWDQALDIILHANKLAAERNGNVLRVTTMDSLTREKEAELIAKRASEAIEPIVVKIFPISYGKIEDIKKILEDFLSKETPITGAIPANAPKRGSIQIDPRTNALIVRDTPSSMEKIKRILKELDTQTPQVLIEAKFVEVKENRQKDVEGRVYSTSREFSSGSGTFSFDNSKNNFGTLFGGNIFASSGLGNGFAISPVQGASFGFQPKPGAILPGIGEIAAFISLLEAEASAKVIASPRVVTQNKETADISQGQTIQLPSLAGANAAGTFLTVSAVLRLQVTPQVTNEGSINLKISFSQDTPSAQQQAITGSLSTDTKQVNTSVLVDSGATLVIGGIYTNSINTSEAGIPILRDIPLIGALFGSKSSNVSKGELFIFLTPRVLNEKEAGIKG